jgi:hypothetical protein
MRQESNDDTLAEEKPEDVTYSQFLQICRANIFLQKKKTSTTKYHHFHHQIRTTNTLIKKTKHKQATETKPKRKKEEEELTGACEASNHYNPPHVTIPKSKPMYQTKIEE